MAAGSRGLLLGASALAALAALAFLAAGAEATHFRGGTIYANSEFPTTDPLSARIYMIVYFKNSYATNTPQVGQTLGDPCFAKTPPGAPSVPNPIPCTGTPVGVQPGYVGCAGYPTALAPNTAGCGQFGGTLPNGALVLGRVCFGDGSPCVDWKGRQLYTDTVNDWVGYEAYELGGIVPGLPHTYADEGPWTYYMQSGDRLSYATGTQASPLCVPPAPCSYHYNNPGSGYRLEGVVTLPADQPYKRNMKPVVYCDPMQVCTISLAATYAPAGSSYSARLTTAAESGGGFVQPGPCGLCGSPSTTAWVTNAGVPAWNWYAGPGAAQSPDPDHSYYSTAVQLMGNGTDRSGLEWIIDLNPIPLDPPPPPPLPPPPPPQPPPVPRFSYTQGTECGSNAVNFKDLSTTPYEIVSLLWSFGDGTTSTEKNPSHLYAEGGAYKVSLTATDSNGKTSTRSRVIAVNPDVVCPTEQQPPEARFGHDPPRDAHDESLGSQDTDGDGPVDAADNCPMLANPRQEDADRDGAGDLCDADADGDGLGNAADNCWLVRNTNQLDLDADAAGDACDDDRDGDLVDDAQDNCIMAYNPLQADADGDGVGDDCLYLGLSGHNPSGASAEAVRDDQVAALHVEATPVLNAATLAALGSVLLLAGVCLVAAIARRK